MISMLVSIGRLFNEKIYLLYNEEINDLNKEEYSENNYVWSKICDITTYFFYLYIDLLYNIYN